MKRLSVVKSQKFRGNLSSGVKQHLDCLDLENETGRLFRNVGN